MLGWGTSFIPLLFNQRVCPWRRGKNMETAERTESQANSLVGLPSPSYHCREPSKIMCREGSLKLCLLARLSLSFLSL